MASPKTVVECHRLQNVLDSIGEFTAPDDDSATDAALIRYVSTFVPNKPARTSIRMSAPALPREYLDKMLAEPFDAFTFAPPGAAVFQLGPFGTAELIRSAHLRCSFLGFFPHQADM